MTRHSFHPQTLDPRSAGKVTRYHSWERLREQSVGEHTWQVIRILMAIWPDVPMHMVVHAMFHDVGERVTGDVPYPVKAENPVVKEAFNSMEREALLEMTKWGARVGPALEPSDATVFKLAEFLEMWEWALDELALGNLNATLIEERCFVQATHLANHELLPQGVKQLTATYMQRRINHELRYRGSKRR